MMMSFNFKMRLYVIEEFKKKLMGIYNKKIMKLLINNFK